jgi:DNA-binding NarL/FixJ family response regulator
MTEFMSSAPVSESARDAAARDIVLDVHVTARESEVIGHVCNGLSNNDIAREMHVAVHTVKTHMRNIMAKMRVRSRLQIAARVNRERWNLAMSA